MKKIATEERYEEHGSPMFWIYLFIGGYVADWGSVMATATMASVPAAVLLVAAQKYIAAGATGGAVKA